MKTDDQVKELKKTLGEELLTPTRIYAKTIGNLLRDFQIHGMSHITGGGLIDNIERILPHGCIARINMKSWDLPPIFPYIQARGGIAEEEMLRTFNNGIGMVLAVSENDADDIMLRLKGLKEKAFVIGEIVEDAKADRRVEFI
jgi:phosphoribosylformylglycinamidine cyclo-ligase